MTFEYITCTKFRRSCDPDHYLVVAKVTERLAVNKQATKESDGERLKEVTKQYQIEISDMFAASENLSNSEDINMAWENIEENIKTSAKDSPSLHELKQHKSWFDGGCLGFLDQRKQVKMQWVQYPSQSNVDILNNVRHEASRHFRNKKKAYLRAKIEELETNHKIKNILEWYRGINDFKKGYQPITNIV